MHERVEIDPTKKKKQERFLEKTRSGEACFSAAWPQPGRQKAIRQGRFSVSCCCCEFSGASHCFQLFTGAMFV